MLKDCKVKPKVIRTDFDNKFMAGRVAEYIEEEQQVNLEAAPPHRQHQNDLVERAWQTITSMARNWLTSSLLPSKYWFAIKRAVEVLNIMPSSHLNKTITTPHEVIFSPKVDYRVLVPMFSVAYFKQTWETGGSSKQKNRTKSLKCILVGSDNKSNGLQFYHPESKQLITANNGFRIDSFLPSGPQFKENFDGSFIFNTKSGQDNIHRPMTHEDKDKVYFKNKEGTYDVATIVFSPFDDTTEPYTVQTLSNGSLHKFMTSDLLDHNPNNLPSDKSTEETPHPLLPWIKPDAKVTLCLPQLMSKPKQGYLECLDGEWTFSPGCTGKKKNTSNYATSLS